jgi:AcrR family transcriptional regulator
MSIMATPEGDGTEPRPGRRGPGRPSQQGPDTRVAILEAAIDAFGRDGFAGTNLRSIADTVGVTVGTLSHHFPSKRELFVTAYAEASRQIVDGYAQALVGASGVHDELDAMLDRSERFMAERPSLTYLTIRAATDTAQPQVRTPEMSRPLHDLIDGIAHRAVARNEIDQADAAALRALVLAMLWGLSITGVDRPDVRAASVRGFRLLFHSELLHPGSLGSA